MGANPPPAGAAVSEGLVTLTLKFTQSTGLFEGLYTACELPAWHGTPTGPGTTAVFPFIVNSQLPSRIRNISSESK